MDTELFDKNLITLDGRMDEPVWEFVQTYTGFRRTQIEGGEIVPVQTEFKVLPCKDRFYIGVKCMEPDIEFITKLNPQLDSGTCDDVEIFLSPSNNYFDFYQFAIRLGGQTAGMFFSEGGNIEPDPYRPVWNSAVYKGEDFWSVEVELPLTAFYMTSADVWSDTWLVNIARTRCVKDGNSHRRESSSWSPVEKSAKESKRYLSIEGFPIRPADQDVRMTAALVEISDESEKGYCGTMTVRAEVPQDDEYEFSSDCAESVSVKLKKGYNEFSMPCVFAECRRYDVHLQLKRLRDGMAFERYYPVRITYEAIQLTFTKPEYRTNFYPGQDYSKVMGKVFSSEPVTLKVEGAGIKTQIVVPDADGSFVFDTSKMEMGEAILTASTADKEIARKIRRLAPSERMASWISNGHFIVDGKPVFSRTMSAVGWHGGQALKKKYEADNLHETRFMLHQQGRMQPDFLLEDLGMPRSDANKDEKPCPEIFAQMDRFIEANKDADFACYMLSDEPECRGLSPVYLKYLYDYITEKDPYHAVRISTRNADGYAECADFFETHPYINPYTDENGKRIYGRPLNSVGKYIDALNRMNRKDKCIGFFGTCYAAMRTKNNPYPTFDEYICCSWAGMIRGAMTLRQYAYHDMNDRAQMYEGTRYIFSSVEALEDILMEARRTTLIRNTEVECALYDLNGERMFVLANFSQEPQTVTLDELSGVWHSFRHGQTITGPTFTLKSVEVLIGTEKVRDAGMPTYQETVALIEKLEYERTHGGSLLFGRFKDIKYSSSSGIGYTPKLFDGVKDNWAWEQAAGDDKFYEIDVSEIQPSFNKVVIGGYHLDEMEIKIKIGDKYIVPGIVEVQNEEFSKAFILKEAVTADALRMEFHKPDGVLVELYEIEVF